MSNRKRMIPLRLLLFYHSASIMYRFSRKAQKYVCLETSFGVFFEGKRMKKCEKIIICRISLF